MENNPSTHEEKVRSFWDRYIKKVHESGTQPPFDRWMVKRAEQYIASFPGRKLAALEAGDVDRYLADLGKQAALKDWQFRQAIDAIRILFELVGVDWLDAVDWNQWRASARQLERNHPTVARDDSPVADASEHVARRAQCAAIAPYGVLHPYGGRRCAIHRPTIP
jgi:hypothetical protein